MRLEEYRSKVDSDKATIESDISTLKSKVDTLLADIDSGIYFKNTNKQENMVDRATELADILDTMTTNLEEI